MQTIKNIGHWIETLPACSLSTSSMQNSLRMVIIDQQASRWINSAAHPLHRVALAGESNKIGRTIAWAAAGMMKS